ncbi:MAG: hypothetical protein RI907_2234, partial [Pseudomonadota bacterium]
PHLFADADPRVRAMYVWHAVEEVEHKGVAYDVLQQVAQAGWARRAAALLTISIQFPLFTFQIVNHMLKVDGYSRGQRLKLFAKGLWWLYGPGGLMGPLLKPWLAWFKPGFHPWQSGLPRCYQPWLNTFERTGGNAIAASEVLYAPPGSEALAPQTG